MKLKLTNFAKMLPEVPEYSTRNQHYSISGVDPLYYLNQSTVQEQVAHPLAAAKTFTTVQTLTDGNVVQMIESRTTSYDVLAITDTGHLYGVGNGGYSDLGQPVGAIPANTSVRIEVAYSKIYFMYSLSPLTIYYRPFTGSIWSSSAIYADPSGGGIRYMKQFLDFLAYSGQDATDSSPSANHTVKKITTSGTSVAGIDLGIGWNITGLENYNNNYLAITAAYSGTNSVATAGTDSSINYLFLWNGFGVTYQKAVRIPGGFVDMKVINDELYVVVLERSSQFALYKLVGSSLKEVFPVAIDSVKKAYTGGNPASGFSLFNYVNSVGLNLATKGQYIYNKDSNTDSKYILTPQDFTSLTRAGNGGTLYGANGAVISSYGTSVSPISYRSQWIDGTEALTNIVIKYATPPQGVGDSIQVTLDGFDEDGTASSSLALATITNTNFYNQYKTPLDCAGFSGKKCRVTLTTTSAGTWQPIIREIELKL